MQQRPDGGQVQCSSPHTGMLKRILLVTDTWNETNGVTNTLTYTIAVAAARGYDISILHAGMFPNIANPFYRQYRLALPSLRRTQALLQRLQPDAVHLITEGPLGIVVRQACLKRGWRFTTSFHTRWDEHGKYLAALPPTLAWKWMRWFHGRSCRVLVPTRSILALLQRQGFGQPLALWERGINTERFHPRPRRHHGVRRPILIYVGRVSREKNLTDFLNLNIAGTKYIVGDGPMLETLQRHYRGAIRSGQLVFFGERKGEILAQLYAEADVLVFPSKTDTFGNVILEALASGVPVAAYPVPGPIDIITDTQAGALRDDLSLAVQHALQYGRPAVCRALAGRYTWEKATDQFLHAVVPVVQTASFDTSSRGTLQTAS